MPARINRRFFLSRGGAAVLAAGVWSQSAAVQSRSPNEKLNIGAIGVGNRGETNVIGVQDENVIALCDVDERYLHQRSERNPHAKQFHDFRKLLDEPKLDAVIISTPDHTHAHATLLALRRGLHVYCEKPLAHSIAETRRIADAARQAKVVTQTGNQHHASAGYQRAMQWIRDGVLGPVTEVHGWSFHPFWPQGVARPAAGNSVPPHLHWDLWLGPAPVRPYAAAYHPHNWRGFWDFGTGVIGDRGTHQLDVPFAALELSAPTSIVAESSPVNDETAPAWSIVRFQFPARQNLPPVKLVWYDGGKQPPPAVVGVERIPDTGTLVVGELAKMFLPERGEQPLLLAKKPGDKPSAAPKIELPNRPNHYAEWLAACKTNGKTSCDFAYGARLTEMCLLGNVALRAQSPIEWDAVQMKVTNNLAANRFLQRDYRPGWEL